MVSEDELGILLSTSPDMQLAEGGGGGLFKNRKKVS